MKINLNLLEDLRLEKSANSWQTLWYCQPKNKINKPEERFIVEGMCKPNCGNKDNQYFSLLAISTITTYYVIISSTHFKIHNNNWSHLLFCPTSAHLLEEFGSHLLFLVRKVEKQRVLLMFCLSFQGRKKFRSSPSSA